MKVILACACGGAKPKAEQAFQILFPNKPTPQIILGKENVAKFAAKYNNHHLKSISKLNGKFSYYINITDDGKITEEYDLYTGRKLA